nr:MAG TPA: hypothetical protein [Caudoviricetes sp.]
MRPVPPQALSLIRIYIYTVHLHFENHLKTWGV